MYELIKIKGVGDKTKKILEKIGIYNSDDLFSYYPYKYIKYVKTDLISEYIRLNLNNNDNDGYLKEIIGIRAEILQSPLNSYNKKMTFSRAKICDGFDELNVIWFNSPYLSKTLFTNVKYIFFGKLSYKNNMYILEHPVFYKEEEFNKLINGIMPIYKLSKGITNKSIYKYINYVVDDYLSNNDINTVEYLSCDILKKYNFIDRKKATKLIHAPQNEQDIENSKNRLILDEFIFFLSTVNKMKRYYKNSSDFLYETDNNIYDYFLSKLPYKLSVDQEKCINEIIDDIKCGKVVNRLIQGDVGCGKTVISAFFMYLSFKNSYQSAIMAPTEVLAKQHYETLTDMFKEFKNKPNIVCLTSGLTSKEKKKIYEDIKSGETDIIIGTHAIIQKDVIYNNLSMVIIDEQHRFGVNQRTELINKGKTPHTLVMSATPIPRTLAVILYGDLDISTIKTMPSGRLGIKNAVINKNDRKKAYDFIYKQIKEGRQAYIICSMVEENEDIDAEDVISYANKLKKYFGSYANVAYIHGKMSKDEKDEIMVDFKNNKINILVSTTVIEVGINVPNATVMLIEDAQRFGLSTLHQLRGRVGRGEFQSYCMFVLTSDNETARKRLEIISGSNDGFHIANEDLKLRGGGELFGTQQSGNMSFNIADIYKNSDILSVAKKICDSEDINNIYFNDILELYYDKIYNKMCL